MAAAKSSLKDFDFLGELGRGSFGVVFKVRRKADGKTYVVKQLAIGKLSRREQQDAINEVNVLASLRHGYICKYYDSFLEKDMLNIVMEYAENGDLNGLLKRFTRDKKRMPENMVWKYLLQVGLALDYIHHEDTATGRKPILHRDLKSLNIFLDRDDDVRLGDFGVAKLLNSEDSLANTVVGTPYYLSPELCENKPYNSRSDVWSLGCVLYECCTLRHPFDATNAGALVLKIIRGTYEPVSQSLYSKSLAKLVDKCLTHKQERRPNIEQILSMPDVVAKARELGIELPKVYVEAAAEAAAKRQRKADARAAAALPGRAAQGSSRAPAQSSRPPSGMSAAPGAGRQRRDGPQRAPSREGRGHLRDRDREREREQARARAASAQPSRHSVPQEAPSNAGAPSPSVGRQQRRQAAPVSLMLPPSSQRAERQQPTVDQLRNIRRQQQERDMVANLPDDVSPAPRTPPRRQQGLVDLDESPLHSRPGSTKPLVADAHSPARASGGGDLDVVRAQAAIDAEPTPPQSRGSAPATLQSLIAEAGTGEAARPRQPPSLAALLVEPAPKNAGAELQAQLSRSYVERFVNAHPMLSPADVEELFMLASALPAREVRLLLHEREKQLQQLQAAEQQQQAEVPVDPTRADSPKVVYVRRRITAPAREAAPSPARMFERVESSPVNIGLNLDEADVTYGGADAAEQAVPTEVAPSWRVVESNASDSDSDDDAFQGRSRARTAGVTALHQHDESDSDDSDKGPPPRRLAAASSESDAEESGSAVIHLAAPTPAGARARARTGDAQDLNGLLDRCDKLKEQLQAVHQQCLDLGITKQRVEEIFLFFKKNTQSDRELSEEEILQFMYGRVPVEKMIVVPKVYHMLYLEDELTKCEGDIKITLHTGKAPRESEDL